MEQQLKEYFVELYKKFQQPGNNPKIKRSFEPKSYDYDYEVERILNFFCYITKKKFDPEDYVFSVDFYKLYERVVDNEPWMFEFLCILPIHYHRIIVSNCSDAYDALTVIVKTIENDWSKNELINYFKYQKNRGRGKWKRFQKLGSFSCSTI